MAATDRQTSLVAACCGVVLSLLSSNAPADEPVGSEQSNITPKVHGELALYDDSSAVRVVTSAVSGSVDNPVSGWSADGSYLIDIISAASVDIVSTASGHWNEIRHAGTLGATYKPGDIAVSASGAVSREPDYLSLLGGTRIKMDLANKMATASFGYSFMHDTAGRTGTPFSVFSLELTRHALTGGIELILDRSTVLSFNADALLERGDQSKPYRFLPVFSPGTAARLQPGASFASVNDARLPGRMSEHVPESRNRFALTTRLARRLSESTIVLSERLYADDWDLRASTTDLRLVVDASQRLEVWGHLRGHVQSSVDFWRLAYSASISDGAIQVPLYRTGDRELSALSTGTFGVGSRWKLSSPDSSSQWSVGLQSDIMLTFFKDALFIRERNAYLNALDLQAEF